MRVLALFDIDGTLISTRGKAFAALLEAFQQVVGAKPPLNGYTAAGKTDPQIVTELLGTVGTGGQKREELVPQVLALYTQLLPQFLQPAHVRLLPGVAQLIPTLASHRDVVLGLLTGNLEVGARVKLERAGLWGYFRLGAFGSDAADRNHLLPFAWQRAEATLGERFPPERTVIVGDTPADVACAKVWNAKAIAVAGHSHEARHLVVAGPDAVVPSLEDRLFLPVFFAVAANSRRG